MGYTTEFSGSFKLTPALNQEQINYLTAFSNSRRVKRHADLCEKKEDPIRYAVGLPVGEEGEFCVFSEGHWMNSDETIIDYNQHPKNQHGLWCHWIPSEDGTEILWNGAEKFYEYIQWINYINENFLKPWGITIDGDVKWFGEDEEDIGIIVAKDGGISYRLKKITHQEPIKPQYNAKAKFKFSGLKFLHIRSKLELLARMNKLEKITFTSSKGVLFEYGWGEVIGDYENVDKFFKDAEAYINI